VAAPGNIWVGLSPLYDECGSLDLGA